MPSFNKVLALAAFLAVFTTAVAAEQSNLRKNKNKKLRRGQINHVNRIANNHNKGEGLEEDVEFFTNLVRRAQDMSIPMPSPTPPPVIVDPTDPPVIDSTTMPTDGGGGVGPQPATDPPVTAPTDPPVMAPTDPPFVANVPTLPPQGVITNPPVPVVGVICAQGESCSAEGEICSDGTTEECCDEVFDSFQCECVMGDDDLLVQDCDFTDACLDRNCDTGPPVSGPTPTPPPVPETGGFNCPDPNVVGCTAVDPANPTDECDTIGEPCESGNEGEFCCPDGCPRNYCTAKQAPMSVSNYVPQIGLPFDEVVSTLEKIDDAPENV